MKSSYIAIIVILALVIAAAFLLPVRYHITPVSFTTDSAASSVPTTETASVVGNLPTPASVLLDKLYTNKRYRISFNYPSAFSVSSEVNNQGEVIIVHDALSTSGFQAYVTVYRDPDTTITKAKLLQNIPDLVIKNEQEVLVGPSGKGLAFVSETYGQEVREVWFAVRGYLYQITAPITSDEVLKQVLNSWQFI